MVGYPDATMEKIKGANLYFTLKSLDLYGLGNTRTQQAYMEFAGLVLVVDEKNYALQCKEIDWWD